MSPPRHAGIMLVLMLAGCGEAPLPVEIPVDTDRGNGARLIRLHGCTACHRIPGIGGAQADVGPPLHDMARRGYVAGVLPNRFDHLVRWLQAPQQVDPLTAMPDTGLDRQGARDVAAYLYRPH